MRRRRRGRDARDGCGGLLLRGQVLCPKLQRARWRGLYRGHMAVDGEAWGRQIVKLDGRYARCLPVAASRRPSASSSTPPVPVLAPPSSGVYRRSPLDLTWSRLSVYSQIYDRPSKSGLPRCIFASAIPLFFIMAKRTATELHTANIADSAPRKQPRASEPRETSAQQDEIGNFEDDWEDEYESDEEVVDDEAEEDRDGMCLVMADKYVGLIFCYSSDGCRRSHACH